LNPIRALSSFEWSNLEGPNVGQSWRKLGFPTSNVNQGRHSPGSVHHHMAAFALAIRLTGEAKLALDKINILNLTRRFESRGVVQR
jgi:hypothetical protein